MVSSTENDGRFVVVVHADIRRCERRHFDPIRGGTGAIELPTTKDNTHRSLVSWSCHTLSSEHELLFCEKRYNRNNSISVGSGSVADCHIALRYAYRANLQLLGVGLLGRAYSWLDMWFVLLWLLQADEVPAEKGDAHKSDRKSRARRTSHHRTI